MKLILKFAPKLPNQTTDNEIIFLKQKNFQNNINFSLINKIGSSIFYKKFLVI